MVVLVGALHFVNVAACVGVVLPAGLLTKTGIAVMNADGNETLQQPCRKELFGTVTQIKLTCDNAFPALI